MLTPPLSRRLSREASFLSSTLPQRWQELKRRVKKVKEVKRVKRVKEVGGRFALVKEGLRGIL